MKSIAYTFAYIALAVGLAGCGISAGPWAGQTEKIIYLPEDSSGTVELTRPNEPVAESEPEPVSEIESEPVSSESFIDLNATDLFEVPASTPDPGEDPAPQPDIESGKETPIKLTTVPFIVPPAELEPAETERPRTKTLIREIDRISRLNSLWEKRLAYREIAERPNLSPQIQTHLVQAVFDNLVSETAKEEILITLIFNPDFDPGTQSVILDRLHNFSEQNTRTRIASILPIIKEPGSFSAQK